MLILLLGVSTACESAAPRDPSEAGKTSNQYRSASIRDIAVLAVENRVPEEDLPADKAFTFPEVEARHFMRRFLIDEKDYAVPTAGWVDAQKASAIDTDAVLEFELSQWDSSRLHARGVIYAGGKFRLRSIKGVVVWSFDCNDLQLAVSSPHGGRAADHNMRDAAAMLVKTALARLPKKHTE